MFSTSTDVLAGELLTVLTAGLSVYSFREGWPGWVDDC